ncbi:MAG: TatD family hydrolase [Flavobacteriales bacterium]|nr:TatD family hydrolase [Flavobacteriales bacterium]
MQFVDTHTHMYLEQFNEDRDACIDRALKQGVNKIFLPNVDSSSIAPMIDLCDKYPENCFPMMGLHPCSVTDKFEEELAIVEQYLKKGGFKGVGEIGIDLHWDNTYVEQQKEAFRKQIKWAKELKLPIVIHARKSFEEIFDIVDDLNDEDLWGIFHCFTGSFEQAQKIIDYGGFKLGIGGVVTYKNSGLAETLSRVDLSHLVLETDAPYLTPIPFRGKRNETSYTYHVAQKLAEIYNIPITEVGELTTKNAHEIFEF